MRKRGKHFQGKGSGRVDRGAWLQAIGMQQPLTKDQIDDLGMAAHLAIERLRIGHPTEGDWYTLAAAPGPRCWKCAGVRSGARF